MNNQIAAIDYEKCPCFRYVPGPGYLNLRRCPALEACAETNGNCKILSNNKPEVDVNLCNGCGECVEACPVDAITLEDRR